MWFMQIASMFAFNRNLRKTLLGSLNNGSYGVEYFLGEKF